MSQWCQWDYDCETATNWKITGGIIAFWTPFTWVMTAVHNEPFNEWVVFGFGAFFPVGVVVFLIGAAKRARLGSRPTSTDD